MASSADYDASETQVAGKTPAPIQLLPSLALNGPENAIEKKAPAPRTKGGMPIARSGPKEGPPAESFGQASGLPSGQPLAESQQVNIPLAAMPPLPMGPAMPVGPALPGYAKAGEHLKSGQTLPLEQQVLSNNYVNREMAANLNFEAEPVNVKVVSTNTAETLQYVQRWARSNSLVDLNEAPADVNFPVYTQMVYNGRPGTNILSANENGVLLRTTRRQAQQIVSELQQQRPLVTSVLLKDEKNSLGLEVAQGGWQRLDQAAKTQVASKAAGPAQSQQAAQSDLNLQAENKDVTAQAYTSSAFKDQEAQAVRPPQDKADADGYLSQITNQVQVRSLDDLVTLVLLVEDARTLDAAKPASKTEQAK